jgi:proton-dependent oligopeptide transporter, POT family
MAMGIKPHRYFYLKKKNNYKKNSYYCSPNKKFTKYSSMASSFNHPKGLTYLFLTELFERFGYYLMIGIFVLYMEDTEKGGFGFSNTRSTDIFGTFIALNYLTPFIGGMLADRLLGYRVCVIVGGLLMGLGYCILAIPSENFFLFAIFLMILGNGFFKPNISTLLGNLYNTPEFKANKDTGYNIFYMGINVGALICNFFAAWARNNWGWYAAFLTAGIGMFVGVLIFIFGNKHYAQADVRKEPQPGEQNVVVVLLMVLVPAVITAIIGYLIPGNVLGSDSTDAFIFGCLPIIVFFLNTYRTAGTNEKRPIAALLAIYAVVIVFWAVFKQNGTALTKWANLYTDREASPKTTKFFEPFQLLEEVTNKKKLYPNYDANFRAPKDSVGKYIKVLSVNPYFINAPEKIPADGKTLLLYNTELFQSINPLWIILLTPVIIVFFAFLRRKQKEPTTAEKMSAGLVITSLSSVVMVFAVWACHNGADKASLWWLWGTYGVVTIGELCLSPMGLSLVSKLAPARIAALMMGGWQLATAIGNKLSGVLASLWDNFDDKANFFWLNAALTAAAALVIVAMLRWLNGILKEYGA